jgi:hypothetical protein
VSLKSWDSNRIHEHDLENQIANPFGDADENDKKGTYRLTVEKALEIARENGGYESFEEKFEVETNKTQQGILKSSFTHGRDGEQLEHLPDKSTDTDENIMTTCYFRFALNEGVDLSRYGLAVVYDNSSPLHVTLVRDEPPWSQVAWRPLDALKEVEVHVPIDLVSCGMDKLDNEMFSTSKYDRTRFQFEEMAIHPMAAAEFTLHDFEIRAKAFPLPPQPDASNRGDIDTIYDGALALFSCEIDGHVARAIDALGAVNYVVNNLDESSRDTLLWA